MEAYLDWLQGIEPYGYHLLLTPISEQKWSPFHIICHIWLWDTYVLTHMVPQMRQNAVVIFVDHHIINSQVSYFIPEHVEGMKRRFRQFRETRQELLRELESKCRDAFTFYVGKKETKIRDFISTYITIHDRHHMGQINAFLFRMSSGEGVS